jgi:integrase
MGRPINRLSARAAQTLGPGLHADGGGLYLRVDDSRRAWIFRFRRGGRLRDMGLGRAADVSLADARRRAAEARTLLAQGIDPIEARDARTDPRTWGEACADYIASQAGAWRTDAQAQQWRQSLADHGPDPALPLAAVTTDVVLRCLQPLWSERTETATRLRGRIERIWDAERVRGHVAGESPARWRGHLSALLPKPAQVRRVRHFAAMPYGELPDFMRELLVDHFADASKMVGAGRLALAWTILTAARTGEATGMDWPEVAGDLWTIPAERMKAGRAHRVPLVPQALALLERRPREAPPWRLSENTMLFLLQREPPRGLGRPYTVHGFRSAFRDWAAEQTGHPSEVIEMALAHSIRDKTEAAYRRGDLLDKRRALMRDWADYLLPTAARPPQGPR